MSAPTALPAQLRETLDLRERAALCGLFGTLATGKLRKLAGESRELLDAIATGTVAEIRDEASDITFVWATVIGDLGTNPAAAYAVALPILTATRAEGNSASSELHQLIAKANTLTDTITAGETEKVARDTESLTRSWARVIRQLNLEPLELLEAANAKFSRRFGYVMDEMTLRGITPTLEQRTLMLKLWDEAKRLEKLTP